MKPYTITFTDIEGKKKQNRFRNGIKVTVNEERSQWYIDNKIKPLLPAMEAIYEQQQKRIKIAQKALDMAEKELEKEGKL